MAELTIQGGFLPTQMPMRTKEFLDFAVKSNEFVDSPGELICEYIDAHSQHQIIKNTTGLTEQRLRQIFDNDGFNFLI